MQNPSTAYSNTMLSLRGNSDIPCEVKCQSITPLLRAQFSTDGGSDAVGPMLYGIVIRPLDHHARERFGPENRTRTRPAVAEMSLRRVDLALNGLQLRQRPPGLDLYVHECCGKT